MDTITERIAECHRMLDEIRAKNLERMMLQDGRLDTLEKLYKLLEPKPVIQSGIIDDTTISETVVPPILSDTTDGTTDEIIDTDEKFRDYLTAMTEAEIADKIIEDEMNMNTYFNEEDEAIITSYFDSYGDTTDQPEEFEE